MAPHEFVEIRLICKADYLDPQLKLKLHEIKDKLREILHTGRRRFALKKVQPWNSVKVTFDIPKEAADRLHLLAVQGNVCLIELGILSVEIVGQSNAIVLNSNNTNNNATTASANPTTNSKDLSIPIPTPAIAAAASSSTAAAAAVATTTPITTIKTPIDSLSESTTTTNRSFPYDTKTDDHRHKRIKLENDNDQQNYAVVTNTSNTTTNNNFAYKSPTTVNLMQPPPPTTTTTMGHPVSHYMPQQNPQILHRQVTPTNNYARMPYPNSISPTHSNYINSGKPSVPPPQSPNLYQQSPVLDNNSTLSNGIGNDMHNYHHPHESWSNYVDHSNNYKMKVNGVRPNHYYPQQQQQQQLILADGSSTTAPPSTTSTPTSSTPTNIYCTPQTTQYDMRRCDTNIPQTTATTTTTNIQNTYDGTSS